MSLRLLEPGSNDEQDSLPTDAQRTKQNGNYSSRRFSYNLKLKGRSLWPLPLDAVELGFHVHLCGLW
jgi:hypothetical protein